MATVKYFSLFSQLNDWPGNLLESKGDSILNPAGRTATTFTITHGPDNPFNGYKLVFVGTGFEYDGNDVVGGVLKSLTIRNAANQIVLQITNIAPTATGSDVSALVSQLLGWTDPGGQVQGNASNVASMLMSGDDVINGTNGRDRDLLGLDAGNDTYNMLDGDDSIWGGVGNDTYNGGDGFDTLSFERTQWSEGQAATHGINVNLVTNTVIDVFGDTDTLNSIEMVVGSIYRDVFLGNADGNDFSGGRGADSFDGGDGNDWVQYQEDVWGGGSRGIRANLNTGIIVDGFGNKDTVVSIERVAGTRFNDTFSGNAVQNVFAGGEGLDSYNGGGNVADSGEGDLVNLGWTFTGVEQGGAHVNLSLSSGQIIDDGFGNTETTIAIEGIIGTRQNDILIGNSGKNLFAGADGQDTMTGGTGNDEYVWWTTDHFNDGDVITDFNAAQDKLSFEQDSFFNMSNIIIENDMNADTTNGTFLFNTSTKVLFWDENGSSAGGQFAIVTLTGVASLGASNFELY